MATSQDVIAFKSRLPEFSGTRDADVATALDEADMWMDSSLWHPPDFLWARMFLAAHHIKLAAGIGTSSQAGSGSDISSDLFVRMVAFGERRVMFGERKVSTTEGQVTGPGAAALEDTIYGQKFLRLRSRNIIGILTV
jgi:Protein of unknown function (DUF4054)